MQCRILGTRAFKNHSGPVLTGVVQSPRMNLGFTEVIIIVAIVIVIFGANRLPELGRGLGKGIKNFKDATKEMSEKSDTDS
jgi:sec-independent protein translocase protein TatA